MVSVLEPKFPHISDALRTFSLEVYSMRFFIVNFTITTLSNLACKNMDFQIKRNKNVWLILEKFQ